MTKFKSKKLLSLLMAFLMVMGVMPVAIMSASAADIKDYTLFIDGLTAKKNNASGATVDLSTLGISASGTAESGYVYEFNNVNFETTAYKAIEFYNDATINLVGENTVKAVDNTSSNVFGIGAGNLIIQGEGSLTVVAGNSGSYNSRTIQCCSFNINGGNLIIIAGNSNHFSYGVDCDSFKMTKGNVEVTSGDAKECYGILVNYEGFFVEGGTLNCASGTASSGKSVAVEAWGEVDAKVIDTDTKAILTRDDTDGLFKNNTTIAKKATVTAMPCEYNSTKYVSIAKALEAIGTGTEAEHKTGTIKLLDNVKEDVEIGEFQEITLDLNGYTLANNAKETIVNYGKLSVVDGSKAKTGKLFTSYIAIENKKQGDLTVTDIKISAVKDATGNLCGIENFGVCKIQGDKTEITSIGKGSVYAIASRGNISITDGKYTASGGSSSYNYALLLSGGSASIGGNPEFILGTSTAKYKAAFESYIDITVSTGKFSGPIVAKSGKTITVTGGSFTENPKDFVDSDNYKVVDNGNTVSYRYTVSEKADTTISAPTTTSKKYDGTTLYATAVPTVSADTVITYETAPTEEGPFQSCNETPAVKDVGTIYVRATAKNPDYKTVSIVYAMSVTKRDVILTSASDSKKYDGAPLTNNKVTVSGDGFAGEEGAEYTVTGSQTEVGESENTFTYKFNQGTNAANYNISTVYGTLTVVLSDKDRFKIYKDELIAGLEVVNGEHDSRYSSKTLDEAKSDIADYIYDESKSYEENVAAVDAIRDASVNKVMARHNFIFSCPFMSFIAEIMEPVFAFLKSLFA